MCVLEANRIGWGASGRNGGQMIAGISGANKLVRTHPELEPLIWDMSWRGNEIIRDRVERYGINCDLKLGYVDVAIKPRHVRALEEAEASLTSHNVPFEHRVLSRY